MRRVYVAGKLNAMAVDYLNNVNAMIRMAERVRRLGFSVFVPCLDFVMGICSGGYQYEDYAGNNMAWLEVSDAVLVLPNWENSKGTIAEITRAGALNIPVFYSIKELAEWKG